MWPVAVAVFAPLTVAAGARGAVSATVRAMSHIEFLDVQEITTGVPAGRAGLQMFNLASGFFNGYATPQGNTTGLVGMGGGLPDDNQYDGLAPRVGSSWSSGSFAEQVTVPWGTATASSASTFSLTLVNVTGGGSEYRITCRVSLDATAVAAREREDEASDGIGSASFSVRQGYDFQTIGHAHSVASAGGWNNDVDWTGVYQFTVGRGANGLGSDFVELMMPVMATINQHAVPSPGAWALLGCVGVVALRRGRPA